jgi:hypothetical protein
MKIETRLFGRTLFIMRNTWLRIVCYEKTRKGEKRGVFMRKKGPKREKVRKKG